MYNTVIHNFSRLYFIYSYYKILAIFPYCTINLGLVTKTKQNKTKKKLWLGLPCSPDGKESAYKAGDWV